MSTVGSACLGVRAQSPSCTCALALCLLACSPRRQCSYIFRTPTLGCHHSMGQYQEDWHARAHTRARVHVRERYVLHMFALLGLRLLRVPIITRSKGRQSKTMSRRLPSGRCQNNVAFPTSVTMLPLTHIRVQHNRLFWHHIKICCGDALPWLTSARNKARRMVNETTCRPH